MDCTRINFVSRTKDGFLRCGSFYVTGMGLAREADEKPCPPEKEDVLCCMAFLRRFADYSEDESINRRWTSLDLKRAVEAAHRHETEDHTLYVSHGSMIEAALLLGYDLEPVWKSDGKPCSAVLNADFSKLDKFKRENNLVIC